MLILCFTILYMNCTYIPMSKSIIRVLSCTSVYAEVYMYVHYSVDNSLNPLSILAEIQG